MYDITLAAKLFLVLFIIVVMLLVISVLELHHIKKIKRCRYMCFVCPYSELCHDGYIKSSTYEDEYQPLFYKHNENEK